MTIKNWVGVAMAVVFFVVLFSPLVYPSASSHPLVAIFSMVPESLRGISVLLGIVTFGVCGYNGLSLAVTGRFWPLQ